MYLAAHCQQSDRNYYSKCRIDPLETSLNCPSELTFFNQGVSKLNSVIAIMRKKLRRSEMDSDVQYYFADNKLFMVDFDKKVTQDVFQFQLDRFQSTFATLSIGLYNNYMYMVVLERQ